MGNHFTWIKVQFLTSQKASNLACKNKIQSTINDQYLFKYYVIYKLAYGVNHLTYNDILQWGSQQS
jgi:hypothetical protein